MSVDSPRTLSDQLFEKLQHAIVRGDLAAGMRLSEAELASRYGVSRGPLREAIHRLESRKLVVRTPHSGTKVVSLGQNELLDIYQIREVLEGLACRLAATKMSTSQIDQLYRLLESHQQQSDLQEGIAYFQQEGDLDFHYRIVTGSGNQRLIDTLCGELYHQIRMYRYQASTGGNRPVHAFNEHQHIVDALADGDGEMAELLMRRHIRTSRLRLEKTWNNSRSNPVSAVNKNNKTEERQETVL
ncbi:GntR family transcriptional regulator [Sansalvadorimonas sp. 2012CJ34-2]|uniref:GntR family transcriptional regulator n=1 Tax=Parendozoicomonas callyspongiae TaxID=2942213 RepID=A0ABT0PLT8_9GAMM|nr:GntR family transcriptional regulator [Sansalvadorimonas sp. 2012CJ34-2]MCL6271946.1 GntR family transcriptional regulator [Sansalvadorimonas sp. 2012CJ34-2]